MVSPENTENNSIRGNRGDNSIFASSGNDLIRSGRGDDIVDAGQGNDVVRAGLGSDTVDGGTGNDFLMGGRGNDFLIGGQGDDIFGAVNGSNIISTGSGSDRILLKYNQSKMENRLGNEVADDWVGGNDAFSIVKDYTVGEDILHILGVGRKAIKFNQTSDYIDVLNKHDNIIVRVEINDDTGPITSDDLTIETSRFDWRQTQLDVLQSDATDTAEPDYLVGTPGNDKMYGTEADEIIYSKQGSKDVVYGGGGDDVFVFAEELNNGTYDREFLMDFNTGDKLDIGDAEVHNMWQNAGRTYVQFGDDFDIAILYTAVTDYEEIFV